MAATQGAPLSNPGSTGRQALARQSLGRPLAEAEVALAAALERAFAGGVHDFGALAAWLQQEGVAAPSGDTAAWTTAKLEAELRRINAELDEAYDGTRPGA